MKLLEKWISHTDPFAVFVRVDAWPYPVRIEMPSGVHYEWELAEKVMAAIDKAKRGTCIPYGRHEAYNFAR